MISKSLMIQLSLAIVLITSAVLIGFGIFRYQANMSRLPEKLEQKLELTAKRLSISLRTPIFNYAEYETRDIILAEMEDPTILAMIVTLGDSNYSKFIYRRDADNNPVPADHVQPGPDEMQISRKILYDEDELGEVTIFMTNRYLESELRRNVLSDLLQILILDAVLVFLVILFLRVRFVLPIKRLTAVSSEISKGRLDQDIDVTSRDEIGKLAGSFAIMRDAIKKQIVDLNNEIDDRKEVEQKLRLSEKRFRQLSNATWESIVIHEDGYILQANDLYYQMFGYTPEELTGKDAMFLTVTAESLARMKDKIASGELGPYEATGRKKDGSEFPIEIRVRMMEFHGRMVRVAAIRDLTMQKRNEQKIADALEFMEKIINESPIGIAIYEAAGQCVDANEAVGRIIGATREQVLQQNCWQIASWQTSGLLDQFRNAIQQNRIQRHELVTVSSFGETVFLDCHVVPFYAEDQVHVLLMVNDISERMKAEEELKHLRNYLKNIVDSMPSILVGVDRQGQVTQWNLEAERVTGLNSTEAAGKRLEDVFPQLSYAMETVLQAVEQRSVRKDSKVPIHFQTDTRLSDVTIYPLITNGVEGAVIRVDDITERVRIEEMIVQSEKMLSIGGLAAGMAHEINNPLAGIIQNVQVLGNRMDARLEKNRMVARECGTTMESIAAYVEKRGMRNMIQMIMEAGKRAAKIVENMLSFSRKGKGRFEECELSDLIDRTIELAGSDYDLKKKYDFRQIQIVREYEEGLAPVSCEQSKIQQVLLNLLKNAAHAMPTENIDSRPPCIVLRTRQQGEMVRIEVEDNGRGMEEEVRKRIFEPFFTTKEVGTGTGLGLSISYFIITEDHGGDMHVDSSPGQGTKFTIHLPLRQGQFNTPGEPFQETV